jgi:O-antigen ligase
MKIALHHWLVDRQGTLRRWLAGLRLLLLLPLLCFLLGETALFLRATQESSARLMAPLPEREATLPFLGITVALERASAAERQAALQRLRQAGFGWVRQRLDWGQIEAQPERYDWRASDALVADIVAADLVPVLVLDGSPAWARAEQDRGATDNPLAPPADPVTFARFAAAVAQRYGAAVRFYQLWDEPNIAPHWGNRHIEPVGYAHLLKAAAPAIRAADPDAVLVLAALAPTADRGHLAVDEVYFLQRLYAAGAAPFFDVVAAQPFGFGASPADERARLPVLNFQRVKLLRRTMLAAGDGATPIWAVRYGWNTRGDSPWRTVTPADQVAFATTALTIARQKWPWLTAMGWAIDQPAQSPTNPQWGFALTPALTEAFRAWQPPVNAPTTENPLAPALVWRWLGMTLLLLLAGWRMMAALCLLPWMAWQPAYQNQPLWTKGVAWLLLLSVYYFATWPPLILLCWFIATLLILPAPLTGLALTAVLLPFYFHHKELTVAGFSVAVPPAHAMLGCLGGALLIRALVQRTARNKPIFQAINQLDALALLWLVISGMSALSVWSWPGTAQGLLNLALLPCLAYGATRLLVMTPTQRTLLKSALFLGGLLAAMGGLFFWWQGQGTAADGVLRLVGPYFSPNHAALYLERIGWLGVGLALSCHGWRQRWLWGALGVIGVALWLTASRGAWLLGMPAGAIVFIWAGGLLQPARFVTLWAARRRWWVMAIVIAFVFLGALGLAAGQPLWERLSNSATVAERVQIWQATSHLVADQWLFGVGPGRFFWHYPRYWLGGAHSDPNLLHPHNLWLELLAEWGALGLGWFLLLSWQLGEHLRWVRSQAIQPPWQTIGLLAAFAAAIAHGQVDTFGALPDLALWQWIALGLLATTISHPVNSSRRDA